MKITEKQLHILRHSLGLDEKGHGREYRNYYCTGKSADCFADIKDLEKRGLMFFIHTINEGRNEYWGVTKEGRTAALKDVAYPKLTRSQKRYKEFLHYDGGLTFKEFFSMKRPV